MRAHRVDAPQGLVVVDAVVEAAGLDPRRAHGEGIDAPVAERQPRPAAVELAPHVWPLAHVDQPRRTVAQFLPAEPQRGVGTGAGRCGQVDERLLDIEAVLVDGTGRTGAAVLQGAVELAEQAQVRPQMRLRHRSAECI